MGNSSRTRSKLKKSEEEGGVSPLVNLPVEIHDEIFLQLPGKSILALRCVCVYFFNLLSSPRFIKNHLNSINIRRKSIPKLLCFHKSLKNKPPVIYSVPIDYVSISSSSSSSYDGALLINYPFKSNKTYDHNILGSCHGLVCLKIVRYDRIENGRGEYLQTCYYSILNPLTGEYKEFLGPNHDSKSRHSGCNITYGFGYDSNIDDYKLVVISDFDKAGCFQIDVYTMKLDSWNRIPGTLNYSFRYGGESYLNYSFLYGSESSRLRLGDKRFHGVFFNGRLHWLGSKSSQGTSSQVITCFDVSNGTMVDMPLPDDIFIPLPDFRWNLHMNLGVWGDCIGVTCVWGSVRTEVWVMQGYSVKESWIRKYTQSLSRRELLVPVGPFVPYWQPLWCFHNGEILVHNCCEALLLYNPIHETVRSVRSVVARDVIMDENRESYVESLVSLDSGTYVEKHMHIR